MIPLKVYFARSLRGGYDGDAPQTYDYICDTIEKLGHNTQFILPPTVKRDDYTDEDGYIHARDLAWIGQCDAMVAEVSHVSHGVGYEIAYAKFVTRLPILLLARKEAHVSAMLWGHNASLKRRYQDQTQLRAHIVEFLNVVESRSIAEQGAAALATQLTVAKDEISQGDKTDWSYLAGLLDGEGCICLSRYKGFIRCALEVVMTDRAALDWAAKATGYGKVYARKDVRPNRRVPYEWVVSSADQIEEIIKRVLPYLKVKTPEAMLFLAFASLRKCKISGKRQYPDLEDRAFEIMSQLKARNIPYQEVLDLAVQLQRVLLERV